MYAQLGGKLDQEVTPMGVTHLDRRLLAILAVDVVAYSSKMEADEKGTISLLTEVRRDIAEPLIAEHHGQIVKLMGDGALVTFESVVDAVRSEERRVGK